MVPQPLPVAQRGKKNAEPGKSLSVSSGVEGAGIDRVGAARAWCCFGIGGKRAVTSSPLGLVPPLACPWRYVLIGATMLYNAYIISQGKYSVSALRSHRHCVHGGGRICGSLWVDILPLFSIRPGFSPDPGHRTENGAQVPTPHQLPGAEEEGLAGQASSPSCSPVPVVAGTVRWSGCHSCALRSAFCSWGPLAWHRWVW